MGAAALKYDDSIELAKIRTDGGTQPRAAVYQNVIDDYADALAEGAVFPPVTVFYDGTDYWLADGFHRHGAHKKIGVVDIPADVRQGTRRDAILFSVGANGSHGLRRTNEDKRRAVLTLLTNPEVALNPETGAPWSDYEIAGLCRVSREFVRQRRADTSNVASMNTPERAFIHPKTGKPTVMNTANIGRSQASEGPEVRASSEPGPADPHQAYVEMKQEWGAQQAAHPAPPANDNFPAAYRTSFTGNNEWYTPARYVEMAREVMGQIDVDPASNDHAQKTVLASTYYTAETNGLDKEWHGKVWMNPPYSQPEIVHFIQKVIDEYRSGRCTEAIVLTHNSTDTGWYDISFDGFSAVCLTTGRVRFESPDGEKAAPAMGQAFAYFGPDPDNFARVFSKVGNIHLPWRGS